MRLPLRTSDLFLVFAAVDALMVSIVAVSAGTWMLAPVVIAAFLIAFAVYARLPRARLAMAWLLVLVLFVLPQVALIAGRPPHSPVNDGVLITDAAAQRLLHGADPYGHDYIDTATRSFYLPEVPVSFSLGHYVYMPLMILLAVPVEYLSRGALSFAWMWIPALPLVAAAAQSLGRSAGERVGAVTAVALNPVLLFDYLYLLNDVFFLVPAIGAMAAAYRRRPLLSGLLFGVALGVKQQAILFLPFLLLLHLRSPRRDGFRFGIAAAVVVLAVVLPFLAWNPGAFLADTAGFFYGSGVDNFPIRGVGLAGMLLAVGVIPNRWAAYPAVVIQLLVTAPVLWLAIRNLRRGRGTADWWPRVWLWLGAVALAVFATGRVLAPNYLDLAVVLLTIAFALSIEDELPAPAAVARRIDAAPSH